MIIETYSAEETFAFGKRIGQLAEPGQVFTLVGDLGVGKTVFTQGVANGLGITEPITSPTFTIVCEYHSGRLPLYHFDVYRVDDPDTLFEIGAEEYFYAGGVSIVEWADMVAEILPDETLCIFIEYGEKEGERIYKCTF